MAENTVYHFTSAQLVKVMEGVLDTFIEYRDVHGKDEYSAKVSAAVEMLQGLEAERELWAQGECEILLQLDPASYTHVDPGHDHDIVIGPPIPPEWYTDKK